MIFLNKDRAFFGIDQEATDKDARRSLKQAYGDVIDAGIEVIDDERLSRVHRNNVLKAVAFSEKTIFRISDALAPLHSYSRGLILSEVEDLLRESVELAYAVALVSDEAVAITQASQADAMRAARTSPEREQAIDDAIARADPGAKKRVNIIIADVARAGFTIGPDAVRERLKKAGS